VTFGVRITTYICTLYEKYMKISGIYRIVCVKNGRFYIGSSVNISKRWWTHKRQLSSGTHSNVFMQRAWNKYGESSFRIEVLKSVPEKELLLVEQQYLTNNIGSKNCMNLKPLATGGISKSNIDTFRYARKGKVPWNKGLTKESDSRVDQYSRSISVRKKEQNIVPWNKGQSNIYSQETINKMKSAKLGKPNPSRAVVNEQIVKDIRALFDLGESMVSISLKYGISPDTVGQIVHRKTWKHVL
jgi:group I intron endonuclease